MLYASKMLNFVLYELKHSRLYASAVKNKGGWVGGEYIITDITKHPEGGHREVLPQIVSSGQHNVQLFILHFLYKKF